MAEWLCSGLQSRVRRFDSDFRLQVLTSSLLLKRIMAGWQSVYATGVQSCIGRVKSAPPPPYVNRLGNLISVI